MKKSSFRNYHPWVILAYLAAVLGITMSSRHPLMVLLSFVFSFCYSLYLHGFRICKAILLCGLSIAFFSMLVMPLFYHNGVTPLFYINGLAVTEECILYGAMVTVLLLAVMQWFFVWNAFLGEEEILYLIGRAMPKLALLITMSLRFVPLLGWRLREIREARSGLGDRHGRHSLRDALGDLSVLLSWSLEDSMETSVSMETRGYGLKRRSSFHLFHWRKRDGAALSGILLLFLALLFLLRTGLAKAWYFPALRYETDVWRLSACSILYGVLACAPLFYDIFRQWRKKGRRTQTKAELQLAEEEYLEKWYGESGNTESESRRKGERK